MKWRIIVLWTVFVVATCALYSARGAHFEYYAGGLTASCNNYSEDYWYYSGPWSMSNTGTESLVVEDYSLVTQASSMARETLVSAYGPNSIHIRAISTAVCVALEVGTQADANGSVETKVGSYLGIFYKIHPDAGEAEGDDVVVRWTGSISIEQTGLIPGSVSGYLVGPGGMDHLAITKGQLPPVTTAPDPNKEVWTMDNLTLNNAAYFGTEEIEQFSAKIGDVIGIFWKSGTSNTVADAQMGTITSNLSATFTIDGLPGDLDGDGDVDFRDFGWLADDWLEGTGI